MQNLLLISAVNCHTLLMRLCECDNDSAPINSILLHISISSSVEDLYKSLNSCKMSGYIARKGPLVFSNLGKWAYNLSGFNQYGLHRDDCLYENEDVKEAVRRLPRKVYDERNYRIMRALHLSMTKTLLPKEQWTKYEDDVKYLEPYLKEVVKEREEREEWNKDH